MLQLSDVVGDCCDHGDLKKLQSKNHELARSHTPTLGVKGHYKSSLTQ